MICESELGLRWWLFGAKTPWLVDAAAYDQMRAFRSPFKSVHEFVYYALLFLVPLHVAGVVFAELKGGGGLISAMITGRKRIHEQDGVRTPERGSWPGVPIRP